MDANPLARPPAPARPTGGLRDLLRCEAVAAHFRDEAVLGAMLRFEAALAAAQSRCGLIPPQAAAAVARACALLAGDAAGPAGLAPAGAAAAGAAATTNLVTPGRSPAIPPCDPAALAREGRRAGTLAIPLVAALTDAVAAIDPAAAGSVHLGATSQDLVDTAMVLQSRAAAATLLAMLERAGEALARLAQLHRGTPMCARTLLQPAVPVSFGWKAAGWLAQLHRCRNALAAAAGAAEVLQFGGGGGTLAALGPAGDAVAAELARELGLAVPEISWHSARDRSARLGAELAVLAGSLAKIGRDVALLMQPEVGEAFEPQAPGRGGSSAMPHKRNPVGAVLACEAALRAPGLAATLLAELPSEHERGLGSWQNGLFVLADLFDAAGSALQAMVEVLEGLQLSPAAMLANLERTGGLVHAEAASTALAPLLGRAQAQALVEAACRRALDEGRPLRQVLAEDPRAGAALPPARLDALFDPRAQHGAGDAMIDRVLAAWRARAPLAASP